MRCYFMRNGHIASVELFDDMDDEEAIVLAGQRFIARLKESFDGFELWEQDRRVFRYPEEDQTDPQSSSGRAKQDGKPSGNSQKKKKFREVQGALHL